MNDLKHTADILAKTANCNWFRGLPIESKVDCSRILILKSNMELARSCGVIYRPLCGWHPYLGVMSLEHHDHSGGSNRRCGCCWLDDTTLW